jgi:hypothetical protein
MGRDIYDWAWTHIHSHYDSCITEILQIKMLQMDPISKVKSLNDLNYIVP